MDHSHMDHGHMNHGGMDHGDMGGGGMDNMCSMNMIFTWDYTNLCVVFRWWRITTPFSLLLSLLAIVALTAGYEFVRQTSARYEARAAQALNQQAQRDRDDDRRASLIRRDEENEGLLAGSGILKGAGGWGDAVGTGGNDRVVKGVLYAVQVFYSFFIMLLFVTYNGYVMLAVAVGAFVGYMAFGGSATKSVACH